MNSLSIDIETYSDVDLVKTGVYKYVDTNKFTILLLAYAFNDKEVRVIDLAQGESIPEEVLKALTDKNVIKNAFNATFERVCISKYLNTYLPIDQWNCTMVHSLMLGLPNSLDSVGKAINLEEGIQKSSKGKALIGYFSKPCKPTKVNGGRTENLPAHDLYKWNEFKKYCRQDVVAEKAIKDKINRFYEIPDIENSLYILDQQINDRGIKLNSRLIKNAIDIDMKNREILLNRAKALTGLENPNSVVQLKKWIEDIEDTQIESLNKENLTNIYSELKQEETKEILKIRSELSKTSVKKYITMEKCMCSDGRARGLLQYYGANRTGRWAGRLIQVHNLPQNKMKELDEARNFVLDNNFTALNILYPSVSDVLSQLIRTAFIPTDGYKFLISDFNAIEARVIAWISNEKWRIDVFNTHGKIYEASASAMFKVPLEEVRKEMRSKGKIAELALGYQGGVGALISMGALKMGIEEDELKMLVDKWRESNKCIVNLWDTCQRAMIKAIEERTVVRIDKNIRFIYEKGNIFIELPSKRRLSYLSVDIGIGAKFGNKAIKYKGMEQTTKKFGYIETYGGKLVENIVQAIARDCLAIAMLRLEEAGYKIVMHVHDEVVLEVPRDEEHIDRVNGIMAKPIEWAKGLSLKGESFETMYYMKD